MYRAAGRTAVRVQHIHGVSSAIHFYKEKIKNYLVDSVPTLLWANFCVVGLPDIERTCPGSALIRSYAITSDLPTTRPGSRATNVLINGAKLVATYTLLVIQRVSGMDERSRYRRILYGPTRVLLP